MRFFSVIAIVLVCTCVGEAFAQAPRYEPYGAWRGRIRYVEGPYRTRTRIRWGGGLTPVGGQVLMHLGTVAGNVAGDYLGSGGQGSDAAGDVPRNAELDPRLAPTITAIADENVRMLQALNEVRSLPAVNLPPVNFTAVQPETPVVDGNPPDENSDPAPVPGLTEKFLQWNTAYEAIESARKEIGKDFHIAAKIAESNQDVDAAKAAKAKQAIGLDVFKDILVPVGSFESTPQQFESSFSAAMEKLPSLKQQLADYVRLGKEIVTGTQARPDRLERIDRAQAFLDQISTVQP